MSKWSLRWPLLESFVWFWPMMVEDRIYRCVSGRFDGDSHWCFSRLLSLISIMHFKIFVIQSNN